MQHASGAHSAYFLTFPHHIFINSQWEMLLEIRELILASSCIRSLSKVRGTCCWSSLGQFPYISFINFYYESVEDAPENPQTSSVIFVQYIPNKNQLQLVFGLPRPIPLHSLIMFLFPFRFLIALEQIACRSWYRKL